MKNRTPGFVLALAILMLSTPLAAEVITINEGGFTSKNNAEVSAGPDAVYAAIKNIDAWWNPDHGWTGDANNFYFDDRVGGCFCERLPDDGAVEHLRIIYLAPGKEIRFEGALGPLQGLPTNGRMLWTIEPTNTGSNITFTFHVFGFMEGGFEGLAPAVDAVVGEQLARLAAFVGNSG